jgi:hypothetical protein
VIERREGGALAARRDIGMAEAIDRIDAEPRRDPRAAAELARESAFGTVQDRLSMQSDKIDRRGRYSMIREERLDGTGMRVRDRVVLRDERVVFRAPRIGDPRDRDRSCLDRSSAPPRHPSRPARHRSRPSTFR